MLLTNKPETKELIVSLLAEGALDSTALQRKVEEQKKVTKQGFYKALRELVKEEVVVKNKQLVVLNNAWVNKLQDLVQTVDKSYRAQAEDSFLNIEEGESLVYHFKTLPSLDVLWMHYFYIIAKKENTENIAFYNAHEFWSLFRFTQENAMYEWIGNNKRKTNEVIGRDTSLDRSTTEYMKQYGIELAYEHKMSFQKNYSITAIGDYTISTIIDMNTANAIDNLYLKHKEWNKNVERELTDILSRLKRSKVVIERNKVKAEKIRKKIMKYFLFYK